MSEHDRIFHQKKCRPHLKQIKGDKRAVFSFVQEGDRKLLFVGKPRKRNTAVETYVQPQRVNRALATMATDPIGKRAKIVAGEIVLSPTGEIQFEIAKKILGANEEFLARGLRSLRKDLGLTRFQILDPEKGPQLHRVAAVGTEDDSTPAPSIGQSVLGIEHRFSDDSQGLIMSALENLAQEVIRPELESYFQSWREDYLAERPPDNAVIYEVVGEPSASGYQRKADQIADEIADLTVNAEPAAWNRQLNEAQSNDALLRALKMMYETRKPHYWTALDTEWREEYLNRLPQADAILDDAVQQVQGLSSLVAQISPNVLKGAIAGDPTARAELVHQIEYQITTQVEALASQPDSPTKTQLLRLAEDISGSSNDVMIAVLAEAVAEEPDWDEPEEVDEIIRQLTSPGDDESAHQVSELQLHLKLKDMVKDVMVNQCPSDRVALNLCSREINLQVEGKIDKRIGMLDMPRALQLQGDETGYERMESLAEDIADYVWYYLSTSADFADAVGGAIGEHSLWTKEKRHNPVNQSNVKKDLWTSGSTTASATLLTRTLAVTMPLKAAAQTAAQTSVNASAAAATAQTAVQTAKASKDAAQAADAATKLQDATKAAEAANKAAEAAKAADAAAKTASIVGSAASAGVSAILCVRTTRQAILSKRRANAFAKGTKQAREEGNEELASALAYATKKVRRQQRAREISATCNGVASAISIAALACTATGVGAPVGLALAIAGGVVAGIGFMATTGRSLFKWAKKKIKANAETKATGSLGNARRKNGRTLLISAIHGNETAQSVLDQIHVLGASKKCKYTLAQGQSEGQATNEWDFVSEPKKVEEKWTPTIEPLEAELSELTQAQKTLSKEAKKLKPPRLASKRWRSTASARAQKANYEQKKAEVKAQQKILEVKKAEITELKAERTVEFRIANRKVRDRMKRAPIMNYMVRKLRSSA